MHPEFENIIQMLAALAAGVILGIERELNSKPSGFRTIILNCMMESCLFSIVSRSGPGGDRIASNIMA